MVSLLVLQLFQVLVLALHDWVPLGTLTTFIQDAASIE